MYYIIEADCGQPELPVNGQVSLPSTTAGSLATYICNDGHVLVGNRQRTCRSSNGTWSGAIPTCVGESKCNLTIYTL